MPGKGFLHDVIRAADAADWPTYHAIAAACVISRYATGVLAGRRLFLDEWAEGSVFINRLCPFTPRRNRLNEALEALAAHRLDKATTLLLGEGHELHADGHHASAADVFQIIALHAPTMDLKLSALRQHAFMRRLLEDWDRATVLYDDLTLRATVADRDDMVRHAELGHACVAMERGNMPLALLRMNAVLVNARAAGDALIEAKALVGRARIAGTRHPHAAETDCFAALEILADTGERERCLVNLGWAQREQGKLVSATETALGVASNSRDAERRAWAQMLLFQLAIDTGDRQARDQWRGELSAQTMTLSQEMVYQRTLSIELATDDDFAGAIATADAMLASAERKRLPELMIQAEKALADLRLGRIPAVFTYRPAPASRSVGSCAVFDTQPARRDKAAAGLLTLRSGAHGAGSDSE